MFEILIANYFNILQISNINENEGPWKNKMKTVAEATRAMKRMDFNDKILATKPPIPSALTVKELEIEVDDSESITSGTGSIRRKGTKYFKQ